ncbi:hypothetical protein [Burkholderia alba]|nr:hypothetical protein [Burkholderia alba]
MTNSKERNRILEWARGYYDAIHGVAPSSLTIEYQLGYADARRG